MKLYHGSKKEHDSLEERQAQHPNPEEIPKDELEKAIYLTPDYGRAVAMGCRPRGKTNFDDINHIITFENPELFNPEEDIYIYEIDSERFSENELKLGENGLDYVATVMDGREIVPDEIKKIKAREVLGFYEITNWKENNEIKSEVSHSFKIK